MLTYKIDVIETLKESGYNSTRILRENLLSQSAMQKLRKREMVGIKTLEQLCELLDMQPGNIIKYVENEPKKFKVDIDNKPNMDYDSVIR